MDHCAARKNEDVDSVVSERHYAPTYNNESRKWLVRDRQTFHLTKVSTMKDHYRDMKAPSPVMGRRTKMIREQLLREAEQEVLNERNKAPAVEEYTTTYDDEYSIKMEGFVPKKDPRSRDLYEKHPLYSSPSMSYWQFKYEKNFGDPQVTPGLTKIVDISCPFKKNSKFSTPITEMDGPLENM